MASHSPIDRRALVVLSGRPGVGKSAVASALSLELGAVLVEIDAIELPLAASRRLKDSIGPVGYNIAYQVATANLGLGHSVVADCVNPIPMTRHAWASVAMGTDAILMRVEVICSDVREHQRRVEDRLLRMPGHSNPDWDTVVKRRVDPWPDADIQVDTAEFSPGEAAGQIRKHLNLLTGGRMAR